MTARPFLRLTDLVPPPPLPAVLALLMVFGLGYLGWRVAQRLNGDRLEALDAAASAVVLTALVAALVHAMALAQLATVAVLRPAGLALAATGLFAIVKHRARMARAVRGEWAPFWNASRFQRAAAILAAVALFGLAAAALGPPTDPDSINYHLGVPLDWLRHGGAYPRLDWFCTRLIGIGEALNMLGLAAGTDCLGATLQLAGMVGAALALRALAATPADRLLAWLLLAACPMMAFLVPNQKPMMLPAAATTIAIVLVVRRFADLRPVDIALALGCAGFAAASKLSFLLSVGFVTLVCLAGARRNARLGITLVLGAAAFALLMLPVLARNYFFFGDPISPFLERLRHPPDDALVRFAHYLRAAEGEVTATSLALLPVRILGTLNPGHLSTVLGLGALAFVPALGVRGAPRLLLRAALAAAICSLLIGQIAPRFFLEPYLWAGAALVAAGASRGKTWLTRGLTLQAGLAGVIALFGAATLFPGALTARWRRVVMERSAAGYTQSEWMDRVLPADAVLIDPGLFHAFTPRPFAVADPLNVASPATAEQALSRLIAEFGANSLVLFDTNAGEDPLARLSRRCGQLLAPPGVFKLAMRNPFNAQTYQALAFRLRDGCAANPSAAPTPGGD